MTETLDITSACDAILREGRITEVPVVSPDAPLPVYDGEDRDVLVQGDLAFIHTVRSDRSVLVQGSILGSAEQPIRVEAHGDIVVTGSVRHAVLNGRRVLVGTNANHCHATTARQLIISGHLDGGRLVAGDYDGDRRNIESCRLSLEHSRDQVESMSRRLLTEEKRLAKACLALRIPLDFNVGRIVQHGDGLVHVELTSFYDSLEGRTDEQMELALAEFFAKGVVGVITRANRKYLVNYPAREKVFMQLVKGLRELFEAALERDRTQRRVDWLADRLESLIESLQSRRTTIEIGGAIAGETSMEFILPRVVPRPKGDGLDFVQQTARVDVHWVGSAVEVVSCGTDGARSSAAVTAADLQSLRFSVDEGAVSWEAATETIGV